MGKVLEKRMRVDADGRLIVEGLTPNHEVDVTVEDVGRVDDLDAYFKRFHGKLRKYDRPFDPMDEWSDEIEPKP